MLFVAYKEICMVISFKMVFFSLAKLHFCFQILESGCCVYLQKLQIRMVASWYSEKTKSSD